MLVALYLLRKPLIKLMNEFSTNMKKSKIKQDAMYLLIIIAFALGMNYLPELTLVVLVIFFVVSLGIQISTIRRKYIQDV